MFSHTTTGISDSKIMQMANASCSYHILWQCILSERPLWLLILLVAKQFTAPNFPQIMLDCVANKANCKAHGDELQHAAVSSKLQNMRQMEWHAATNSGLHIMWQRIGNRQTYSKLPGMLQQTANCIECGSE